MANMQKPVLASLSPFDANKPCTLKFYYSGDQIVKKQLEITNSKTSEKVTLESVTRNLSFVIDGGTLKNNTTYYATLTVYNIDGDSTTSDSIYFMCIQTPEYSIISPTDGQSVKSSYIKVDLNYSQPDGEELNAYEIILYNNNMTEIMKSGTIYTANESEDKLTYTFYGLDNKVQFKVKAVGQTKNGVDIVTEVVTFYTDYISSSGYSTVFATNDSLAGNVTVNTHFIAIDGKYAGTPVYVDDKAIDLTDGVPVIYDEGFNFSDDFTVQILVNNFVHSTTILNINDDLKLFTKPANIYSPAKNRYFGCVELGKEFKYVVFSKSFNKASTMLFTIKRINGFLNITAVEVHR